MILRSYLNFTVWSQLLQMQWVGVPRAAQHLWSNGASYLILGRQCLGPARGQQGFLGTSLGLLWWGSNRPFPWE